MALFGWMSGNVRQFYSALDRRGEWTHNLGMNSKVVIVRCGLGLSILLLMSCSTQQREEVQVPEPVKTLDPESSAAIAPDAQVTAAMTLNDARQVQAQVMDFADEMTLRLAEAIDEIENKATNFEARTIAHRLKYTVAHGATIIAAAQNPRIALVDMYVMITLQRTLLERKIIPQYYGDEANRLLTIFVSSEKEIRRLTEKALAPEQIAEIDRLIAVWLETNPDRIYASYVRFSEFSAARLVTTGQTEKGRTSNVLGFLFIDPLAGLDPTTRELEQVRLFAERAFFYMQRVPMLISWQAELLYIDTVGEPETRKILANTDSLTKSVEKITAEITELKKQFPELVSSERQAILDRVEIMVNEQRQLAIEQALVGLSAEREALINQLAAEEEKLGSVITELRMTVESTTALSDSVRSTTEQFAELATLLKLDEPKDPDAEQTNIKDFTEALRETTIAAGELVKLSESIKGTTAPDVLEERLAMIEERLMNAEQSANRLIDRAFRMALILVAAFIVGLMLVVGLSAWLKGRGKVIAQ